MQRVYAMDEVQKRKLKFLYHQSAINSRYSVLPDYSRDANEWQFYPASENLEPFPGLEYRMQWYHRAAPALSVRAITQCIDGKINKDEITHLITVSCTGMSAPGLDLQIMELMDLPQNIFRTSINFMGCFAAIHGMKLADAFCAQDQQAKVIVVCTELCTLHFQKDVSDDSIASALLFGDGAAAMLITAGNHKLNGWNIQSFHSEVAFGGKKHMSWELSSKGFLMQLSGYVPALIEQGFDQFLKNALQKAEMKKEAISAWCIHPGGKRILAAIEKSSSLAKEDLAFAYHILREYGNMSSPTILFVLNEIVNATAEAPPHNTNIFGAAFGPGITMESFILNRHEL